MEKVIFNVIDIQDSSAESDIRNALETIDGIDKIDVRRENNQIEVTYYESTSASDLGQCIESTGHHITKKHISHRK
jgi:copper chaperone CopZ